MWNNIVYTIMTYNDDCIVCCEAFNVDDLPLPCGHWIHLECVKKSADAMQEVRSEEGYPPLRECPCPICRRPVSGIVPKDPPEVPDTIELLLDQDELLESYKVWRDSDQSVPLSWYIWITLCDNYTDQNPETLRAAAHVYAGMIITGTINIFPDEPDERFSTIIQRAW